MTTRTFGVEEEFLLVDAQGRPRGMGERALAAAGADHELKQEQAETASVPQVDLARLGEDLRARRRDLATVARREGLAVLAVGTSPLPVEPTATDDPRYQRMMAEYGLTASEQLTCGCHVHVAVGSRAEGVAALNGIAPWLPVLTAMSGNSPFWQGEDSGYASYRRLVWGRWPGAGPTQPFDGEAGYDEAVGAMLRSGVLLDEGMVYFDARLSAKYPTLEIRVADVCLEVDDAVLVAALCRALVDTAATGSSSDTRVPRPELLRGASWRAARSGLSGDLVDVLSGVPVPAWTLVQRLVDHVAPALRRYGDLAAVESSLERLRRRGTGAEVQRASFGRRRQLTDVVTDAVRLTAG